MIQFKTTSNLLNTLKILLCIFVTLLILILPQLNITEYVLPTITTKTIYFLYANIILCVLYTFIIIFSKEITFSFSKIDIILFTLVLYIILNRYFIQSHYGFSIRYMELLGLSFLYVILRSISLKNYPWLLLSIVVSGIMQAVYGNLQLLGYYPSNHSVFKMTGSFFNPGPYAGFLVSVWIVALGMYLFKDSVTAQVQSQIKSKALFFNEFTKYTFEYIPLLGIISIALVLPATQSRASWIASIVGSGVLLELKYYFIRHLFNKVTVRFQKTTLMLLAVGILSIGLINLYHYKKKSSDGRSFIWKVTTEMISDAPLFGVGFDDFDAHYMNYQKHYFAINGETPKAKVADNTYYAFNEGLQFMAENGLLGFLILLIVVYVLFQTKVNENHQIKSFIAKTGLLTIGVFACFSYPMQILPIKLILVFLLAILSNITTDVFQLNIGENKREQWIYKIIVLLFGGVGLYQTSSFTKNLGQGFITWNTALTSHQYEDYKVAIQEYEKVYPVFNKNGDFLMNYGKTLTMDEKYTKAIAILEQAQHYQNNTVITTALGDCYKATKQYKKAEACYQQAINMAPAKFYANYLLAKLYDTSGQEDKAITMAKKILDKEVKIPSTAIKEIRAEMKKILIKHKILRGFKN